MKLPDDDDEAINRMIQFLYTTNYELSPSPTVEQAVERHWQLAKLYVLADKYDFLQLKNDVIGKLYHRKQWGLERDVCPPPVPVVSYVCENTSEHSSFRKLLVSWLVWFANAQYFTHTNTRERLCMDAALAADLAIGLSGRLEQRSQNPFDLPRAVHDETYAVERVGKVEGGIEELS